MSRLISPMKTPHEFGFKLGDSHLVLSASSGACQVFSWGGVKRASFPVLLRGLHRDWRRPGGDTPPGLYKLGQCWNDWEESGGSVARSTKTRLSYGWVTFDMIDLEGNEDRNGRAGLCAHGGGTALGWPGAWKPYQELCHTHGCPRFCNAHLLDVILPLWKQGDVYLSVHQFPAR